MKLRPILAKTLVCATFLAALSSPSRAEIRAFTDSLGRTLRGELVAVNGDFDTIKRESDGQTFTVKAGNFSPTDITYFKEHGLKFANTAATPGTPATASAQSANPPRINVTVYPKKSERNRGNNFYDKVQKTNYKIEIKNTEQQRDVEQAQGTLLSFAKVMQTPDESELIGHEEFQTGPIKALSTFTYESKEPVKSSYDSYDIGYGLRYSGYILILKDASGAVLNISASSETLAKHSEDLLKLKLWNHYDKNYKKTSNGVKPYEN